MPTSRTRSYNQLCGIAMGLDLLGKRWTLLIVRELLTGARRFSELEAALPGLGPNLLSERLGELVDTGVVAREAIGPSSRREHYFLTAAGEELRPTLLSLARWGLRHGPALPDEESAVVSPSWAALAVESLIDGRPAAEVDEHYEFHVGDTTVFHVKTCDGKAHIKYGPFESEPELRVWATPEAFVRVGAARVDLLQAIENGDIKMEGPLAVILRCCALMGITWL